MASFAPNIGELLRRAQLQNQLSITGGQPIPQGIEPQGQDQSPQYPSSSQANSVVPTQSSERDKALNSYRQALQAPAPQYNPSILRRVIGGLLGAGVGITNPQAGNELSRNITQQPYNKQLSEYQQNLAQKKAIFDLEEGAQKESSLENEQRTRTEAEKERASAEVARRLDEEGKLRTLQPGTPEYKAELEKLKIQHPNTPKLPSPYELELKNGEKIPVAYEQQNGQFKDTNDNIYGPDAIKSARKIGTNEPKSEKEKPEREGEAGAIDQWTKEHGRAPNYSERVSIHRQYAEKPVDSGAAAIANEFKLQTAKTAAARSFERNRDLATQQLDRIDRGIEEVNSSKPTDLAIAIPTVLTALVSGQGTGVRITQAEMNNIIKARGFGDSIQAFTNKLQGLGNLADKQKVDLKGLLSDVRKKVEQRQRETSDTADAIYDADDLKAINAARTKYNKKLIGQDQNDQLPGGITLDDINKEIARRKGQTQ